MTAGLRAPSAAPQASGQLTRSRRNARRSWTTLIALVALVALAVWLVAFSPVLGVRSVTVRGASAALPADEVRRVAAVPHGRPLTRVPTGAIERRVESLPRVASATVSVSYPSTVVITVTARVAAGYVGVGGGYALVDRTGRRFDTVPRKPRLPLLFATGAAAHDQATLAALATVAAALSPTLRAIVRSVNGDDPDHIALMLTDGRSAIWGTAERATQKVTVLTALLHRPGRVFDVSDPALVVVR